tara:strand:- start:3014 stop:3208 length:195 start_codon:yes stop_codon:yes gene_type:complete
MQEECNAPPVLKLLPEQILIIEKMILKLQVEATLLALSEPANLVLDLKVITVKIDQLAELINHN